MTIIAKRLSPSWGVATLQSIQVFHYTQSIYYIGHIYEVYKLLGAVAVRGRLLTSDICYILLATDGVTICKTTHCTLRKLRPRDTEWV